MTSELRACPFCGSEAWVVPIGPLAARVECQDCDAMVVGHTRDRAITAWNTRAEADQIMAVEGWRPEVRAFADLMEAQLRANDHKPGWKDCSPVALWRRIGEESEELFLEIWQSRLVEAPVPADSGRVGREAADVANFAMMIADVCGALKAPAHDQ